MPAAQGSHAGYFKELRVIENLSADGSSGLSLALPTGLPRSTANFLNGYGITREVTTLQDQRSARWVSSPPSGGRQTEPLGAAASKNSHVERRMQLTEALLLLVLAVVLLVVAILTGALWR